VRNVEDDREPASELALVHGVGVRGEDGDSSSATGKAPGKGEKGSGVSPEVDGELG
jgi:hypothetical protein